MKFSCKRCEPFSTFALLLLSCQVLIELTLWRPPLKCSRVRKMCLCVFAEINKFLCGIEPTSPLLPTTTGSFFFHASCEPRRWVYSTILSLFLVRFFLLLLVGCELFPFQFVRILLLCASTCQTRSIACLNNNKRSSSSLRSVVVAFEDDFGQNQKYFYDVHHRTGVRRCVHKWMFDDNERTSSFIPSHQCYPIHRDARYI